MREAKTGLRRPGSQIKVARIVVMTTIGETRYFFYQNSLLQIKIMLHCSQNRNKNIFCVRAFLNHGLYITQGEKLATLNTVTVQNRF